MHNAITHTTPAATTAGRIGGAALLGVLLWLEAAVFIRYGAPPWLFGGTAASVGLFALTIPLAWVLVWCLRRVSAQGRGQVVVGVAIVAAAACLCDAVALTWQPTLYGERPGELLPAFAWLFWFVGISLVLAVAADRRRASRSNDET